MLKASRYGVSLRYRLPVVPWQAGYGKHLLEVTGATRLYMVNHVNQRWLELKQKIDLFSKISQRSDLCSSFYTSQT